MKFESLLPSSNVVRNSLDQGSNDSNFNAYAVKVDKLATRITEFDTILKQLISTTHELKQHIVDSENNLKVALNQINNKIPKVF